MRDSVSLSGVVIFSAPVGENDRRLVVITREAGRVTMFAPGSRKPTSRLSAFTRPFTFAKFSVYPGKDAYRLLAAEMMEGFDGISADFEALTYGSYFLELAGYFTEENVEAAAEVDLLYVTIRALLKKKMPCPLIRAVFELRILSIQGIAPRVFDCAICNQPLSEGVWQPHRHGLTCLACVPTPGKLLSVGKSATYAMQFVESVDITKLYTFLLEEKAAGEFIEAMQQYYHVHVGKKFKSLEMIL